MSTFDYSATILDVGEPPQALLRKAYGAMSRAYRAAGVSTTRQGTSDFTDAWAAFVLTFDTTDPDATRAALTAAGFKLTTKERRNG